DGRPLRGRLSRQHGGNDRVVPCSGHEPLTQHRHLARCGTNPRPGRARVQSAAVRIDIPTADGMLDTYVFTPEGAGSWPAVVFYMDAFGIREQLKEMAQRLASNGFVVAVPNLYFRSGAFAPFDPRAVTVEGPERTR